ncbi:TPA: hypothetical protein MI493_27245 [Klebsiella pneumoniae]|uniref:Uncharacterized protein n=1 Tax=Klebsiella quasivariicola TaxID=2026240 RepID=A0A8B4U285_9ENTR|nr:hypothetical protein SG64_24235 [Enterobacter hormaechei subsp. xiangfangensis]KTJ75205.1 hypothetical protein ASU76_22485 [Enterobacter hormaechei subsp. hoffmannii]SAG14752.1 Uncharacterised protein [Enterobacter hormaechei]SXE03012.1 Uncharacterised protein [Klebsiella quasivariicola]SYC00301.1 Uncharacterised protein [Klebsiella pneumoniae]
MSAFSFLYFINQTLLIPHYIGKKLFILIFDYYFIRGFVFAIFLLGICSIQKKMDIKLNVIN